jgi:hypothetical protein
MHRIKKVWVYMYKLNTLKKNQMKQISCNYFKSVKNFQSNVQNI